MIITASYRTFLKKEPTNSDQLSDEQKVSVLKGKTYDVLSYQLAEGGHYQIEINYGAGSWYIWSGHWHLPWEEKQEADVNHPDFFTLSNLKSIMPFAKAIDIATYISPLNQVLYDFDLATTVRACAFIAQIAHESGSLQYKEEIASGTAYEGRRDLGNNQPGDGSRFKGRGLIQLTGRANYRQCGQALNLPLEQTPELVVKDPYTNAAVAAWYWQSRNINDAADRGDFQKVTRLINGGLNGYSDRLQFWERAKLALSDGKKNIIPQTWEQIYWQNPNAKVSQYFTVREVTQGDVRRIPIDNTIKQNIFTLAQELDKVRQAWGSPILVTSWYRPPAINHQVGGVSNSQHIQGSAADIYPANNKIYDFQSWLDQTAWQDKALGYGAKRGFVHLDLRQGNIRWNY